MIEQLMAPRQRYLLTLQYSGHAFAGCTRTEGQINARPAIQTVLEEKLAYITGLPPLDIAFSSRTDAGVHALRNTVHVDLARMHPRKKHPLVSGYFRILPSR